VTTTTDDRPVSIMQIVVPTLAVKYPVISRISCIARGYCSALEPFLTGLPQNPVRPAVECLGSRGMVPQT
jgi:hypothetical protein